MAEPIVPAASWKERIQSFGKFGDSPYEVAMTVLVSIAMAVLALVSAMLFRQRKTPAIINVAPKFYGVMILGSAMLLCVPLVWSLHMTPEMCSLRMWLLYIGWMATFAPIILKLERIRQIFKQRTLKVKKLKDSTLFKVFGTLLLVDVVFMSTWQGLTKDLGIDIVVLDPFRKSLDFVQCSNSHTNNSFAIAAVVLRLVLVLVAVVLAFCTRNVYDQWNESKTVAVSAYNLLVVVGVALPIAALEVGGREFSYVLRSIAVIFIAMTTVLIVPGFRIVGVYMGWNLVNSSAGTTIESAPKLSSGVVSSTTQMTQLVQPKRTIIDVLPQPPGHKKYMLTPPAPSANSR